MTTASTRSACSETCPTTRWARPVSGPARRHQRAATSRSPAFDGDMKAGGDGPCSDENLYTPVARLVQHARAAAGVGSRRQRLDRLLGTLWPGTGDADPLERLNLERLLFTAGDRSLGRTTLRLTRESSEGGAYAQYPREPPLDAGSGRLHRPQRAGVERQLPVRAARGRPATTRRSSAGAYRGDGPQGSRSSMARTRDSTTRRRYAARA